MQPTKTKEAELIETIKAGNLSAFGILVDTYKTVAFSLACSILKNQTEAEDALQEAFIKAFKNLKQFKRDAKFSTWLYAIVVNTCKSHLRTNSRTQYSSEIDDSHFEEAALSAHEIAELQERTEIINAILAKMKADESLLLRLFYLAEMSIKEIQEITNFQESKVKVTLLRARKSFFSLYQIHYKKDKNMLYDRA